MHFEYEGKQYEVTVTVPEKPYPKEGLPVLYVLDGRYNGVVVNEIVKMQMHMRKQTKIARMIVVTIAQPPSQRFADFTPHAESYVVSDKFPMPKEGPFGEAQIFSDFIETMLKPYLTAHYPVGVRHILLGHSLSAYFVLWQMVTISTRFTNYIAISPSLWWNDEALVQADFSALNAAPPHSLYIAAGQYEGSMHGAMERFIAKLPDFPHTCYIAPEENHLSVFPTVLSRALRYVQVHK